MYTYHGYGSAAVVMVTIVLIGNGHFEQPAIKKNQNQLSPKFAHYVGVLNLCTHFGNNL